MAEVRTIITLGNGQLGLMLGKAAKKLEVPFLMLSISEAWNWIETLSSKGDGENKNVLLTFEQEHVDEKLLTRIRESGLESFPSWECFHLLKNKRSQKEFLLKNGIPTTEFLAIDQWSSSADQFIQKHKGAVLKAGSGGYDGNGVWIVDAKGLVDGIPAQDIAMKIKFPYLEKRVSFAREVAAVVCRSSSSEILHYPTVVSIQDQGICSEVEYTEAFASTPIAQAAKETAGKIISLLGYVGVLAVECFDSEGKILVNEIAPRVHNSGHFTIDVCEGSQFENHLRAGLGYPLAKTEPSTPAALMVNLLWPKENVEFVTLYTRLTCGPQWPENVKLHWYGKSEARPRRKMGHFTVFGKDIESCHKTADQILASRWVKG